MARNRNPFQLLGTANEYNATSAYDLMRDAGLDWKVQLTDVYAAGRFDTIKIEDKFATTRMDADGKESVLSVVGSRYKVFQNAEIFGCLDNVVGKGELSYAAAGELKGGCVVWTLLKLPQEVSVGDDMHEAYILARTSHDGSTPFQMTPIINRIQCTNQINARMFDGKASGLYYSVRHSTNSAINEDDVRVALNIAHQDVERYVSVSSWLRGLPMDNSEFEGFIRKVYPMSTKMEYADAEFLSVGERRAKTIILNNRLKARSVWLNETDTQHNLSGTKFGAFQAVVEAFDHKGRSGINQAQKIILGTDVNIKSKALELLGV